MKETKPHSAELPPNQWGHKLHLLGGMKAFISAMYVNYLFTWKSAVALRYLLMINVSADSLSLLGLSSAS